MEKINIARTTNKCVLLNLSNSIYENIYKRNMYISVKIIICTQNIKQKSTRRMCISEIFIKISLVVPAINPDFFVITGILLTYTK